MPCGTRTIAKPLGITLKNIRRNMKIKLLKTSLILLVNALLISNIGMAQSYTTTIDTFYVSTPEYSTSLGLDSLFFPSAITTPNTGNNFLDTNQDGNATTNGKSFDGNSIKVAANYGTKIGEKGGFANFTTEYINKEKTLRPGFDFRRGFGEAAIQGFNFFVNAAIPVSDKSTFYAFGGRNFTNYSVC